jgi:hypothetical protein
MWLCLLIEEQKIGSLYSYDLLDTQYDKEVGRLARSNSVFCSVFCSVYEKIFRRSNSSFIPINSFVSLPKLNQPNHMCPSGSVLQKVGGQNAICDVSHAPVASSNSSCSHLTSPTIIVIISIDWFFTPS